MITDTQILDWLERHPKQVAWHRPSDFSGSFWFRVFGLKDSTNRFTTLREAVAAQLGPKDHRRKK